MASPLRFRPPPDQDQVSPLGTTLVPHLPPGQPARNPYSAYLTYGSEEALHFRSVSMRHINVMTHWECKKCHSVFSKRKGDVPWMAYCGHFIHRRCHSDKVPNAPESYFKCPECPLGKVDDMEMPPLLDPVLEDFFEKLLEKGIRCTANNNECKKQHARYNIFYCPSFDIHNKKYYCVWCATTAEFEEELAPLEKKIVPSREGVTLSDKRTVNALASLDRSHSMNVNQCCLCRDTLCRPFADCAKVFIAYLSCNHVCHVACSDKYTVDKIECNFCGKVSKRQGMPKRIWHSDQYLNYNQDDRFYVCEGRCKQSHPRSNFIPAANKPLPSGVCVWCTVEQKEDERIKNKKDEEGDN